MGEIRTLSQLLDVLKQGYIVQNGRVVHKALGEKKQESVNTRDTKRFFCVSIAGRTIAISSSYEDIFSLCKDFICDKKPEIFISVTEEDLAYERNEANKDNILSTNGYLETLAIHRRISEEMLAYDTFLMHGAVLVSQDNAYMFTAESGTGKTTHIKKWLENLKDAYVLNGDKPFIRIMDNQVIACGTPWRGKERMGTNAMADLRAIVLMERADNNTIEEITYGQAFNFLLQQIYRPSDINLLYKTLSLLTQLKNKVRFFRFSFNNMKDDVFQVAYNALVMMK